MARETKCWTCKRSTDYSCTWSRHFQPVDGWEAEERHVLSQHTYKGRMIYRKVASYRVISCPMYEWNGRSIVPKEERRRKKRKAAEEPEPYSGPYYDAPCCLRCWTRPICHKNGYKCNERERVKEVV